MSIERHRAAAPLARSHFKRKEQAPKVSFFQKKKINMELEDIKAYRKQFEDDNSFKTFKPARS